MPSDRLDSSEKIKNKGVQQHEQLSVTQKYLQLSVSGVRFGTVCTVCSSAPLLRWTLVGTTSTAHAQSRRPPCISTQTSSQVEPSILFHKERASAFNFCSFSSFLRRRRCRSGVYLKRHGGSRSHKMKKRYVDANRLRKMKKLKITEKLSER